jgi:hypothetical protein
MSYLSIFATKTTAHILTDTGGTDPQGNPIGVCSKLNVIPHLNAVYNLRGLGSFAPAFTQVIQQSNVTDFDNLIERIVELAETATDHIQAFADADLIEDWDPALLDIELVFVGFSQKANAVKVIGSSNRTGFQPYDINAQLAYEPMFVSLDNLPKQTRQMKDPLANLVSLAKSNHETASKVNFVDHGGRSCKFGGGMVFAEVTKSGITIKHLRQGFSDLPLYNHFTI